MDKTTPLTRLPIPLTRTARVHGGEHCVFDVLAERPDPAGGLMRLCRDALGGKVTYYVRWGVDHQGTAKGGAQRYKLARDAVRGWNRIVQTSENRNRRGQCPVCQDGACETKSAMCGR